MAGSNGFRDKIEERYGTEWYDAAKKVGDLHDPRTNNGTGPKMYSGAEVRAEMRHGRGDMTTEELTKKYEDLYAAGKINLNGNAQEFLTEHHGANFVRNNKGEPGSDGDSTGGGGSTDGGSSSGGRGNITIGDSQMNVNFGPGNSIPGFGPGVPTPGGQYQSVVQDNDITQSFGDNNTITNNVDNSVNQQSGGFSTPNDFREKFMKKYDFFK